MLCTQTIGVACLILTHGRYDIANFCASNILNVMDIWSGNIIKNTFHCVTVIADTAEQSFIMVVPQITDVCSARDWLPWKDRIGHETLFWKHSSKKS